MNGISVVVQESNSVPNTSTTNEQNTNWAMLTANVRPDSTIHHLPQTKPRTNLDPTWYSKHKMLTSICAFGWFTIVSMISGIIIVCLTAPNSLDHECVFIFNHSVKPIITYDMRPKHIAVADLNQDAYPDLVIANSGTDSIGIILGNDDKQFTDKLMYSTGKESQPYWVGVEYFNNDTALDIVVANYRTNSIGIFLNNGNGTFSDQMTFSLNSSRPVALAVQDFNNDTYLDIVVVSNGTFYLTLLLGDGNGSFSIDSQYYMGYDSMPCSLAVADFNDDRRPDIVTVNYGTSDMMILLATDNGTFIMNRYSTGNGAQPCSVSVNDFNNDSYIDIAVVNSGTNNIGIFLGNGDGTFTYIRTYSTNSSQSYLQFIVSSDINDDKHIDLIVADPGEDSIIIFEGDGQGSFIMKTNQSTGYNSDPCAIATGYFDNDTTVDIVVADIHTNNIRVFTAYGFHTAAVQPTYPVGSGAHPNSVSLADFNNDSWLDIVVANTDANNIGIFLGSGDGNFNAQTIYRMYWENSAPDAVSVGDFNNDHHIDIAVTSDTWGTLDIYLGLGDGSFKYNGYWQIGGIDLYPNSISIVDLNNDTYLDIITVDCDANNLTVLLGMGNATFQHGNSCFTGYYSCPAYVAVGDFNSDGVFDLASADYFNQQLAVFIGIGNGTFLDATYIPIGDCYAAWLAIGDLNNDRYQDIVIVCPIDSIIGILLGNNNGSFRDIYNYSTGYESHPLSVVLGDFSKDGKTDIAVATGSDHSVIIFFGDGNGIFTPQAPIIIDDVIGCRSMAIGDLNNDKQVDLVVGNAGSNDITTLLLQYEISFGNQMYYPQGTGAHPFFLTSFDFNNDNQMDIIVANSANDTVQLLIGFQKNGTFMNNITYSTGTDSHPRCIVTGDFNKDNYTDIAVVNSYTDTLMIFLLSDNQTFRTKVYSTGYYSFPNSLALGDFNEDGWVDIVVANNNTNNVGVFLGYDYPRFIPYNITSPKRGSTPFYLVVADLNKDSLCDIIVAYQQIDAIGILIGNGDGTFLNPTLHPLKSSSQPSSFVTGDFNNDTLLDIVVVYGRIDKLITLLGSANGTFAMNTIDTVKPTNPVSIAIGDFNNDTKQDLVVANLNGSSVGVFMGYGNGSFTDEILYSMPNGSVPVWVVISDFNNDNILDIAVANRIVDNIGILLGYGDGSFRSTITYSTGNNSGPCSIDVGDFNKDDCIDIAVANQNVKNVGILLGDCNGTFLLQRTYSTGTTSTLVSIAVKDLNNDTILDIIVTDWGAGYGNVGVLYGMKNGTFLVPKIYSTGFDSQPTSVGFCDFNNDGLLDFAVTNSKRNNISIMFQDESEPFGEQRTYSTGNSSRPYSVAVTDFDNDGHLDIGVANSKTNTVGLFYGYGDGSFEDQIMYSTSNGSAPWFLAVGYLDNDEHIDIVVANSHTNNIGIFYGYGNRNFTSMEIYLTGERSGPTSVALADLDKNNCTDIIVTNAGINNVLLFYGYGNRTFDQHKPFPFHYGNNPISATIGDFNNDSWLDIGVANYGPGYVEVLLHLCYVYIQ